MRHQKRNAKLGRKGEHRNAMLANLVCSLIKHKRVTTTLAKAKAARPVAEKLVTLGKRGTMHDRRLAAARLRQQARTLHRRKEDRIAWREKQDVVRILFDDIAPNFKERNGGYTRIIKLASFRRGDAGEQAILEWVDNATTPAEPKAKAKVKESAKEATPETEEALEGKVVEESAKAETTDETAPPAAEAEEATAIPETESEAKPEDEEKKKEEEK